MRMDRRTFTLSALTAAATAATPRESSAQRVQKFAEQLKNGEFNWFPERSPDGPILIIVSIPDQRLYVYRNGVRIAASSCSTGKKGHATPTGVFKILQKDKNHHSSTYNNAPMPNMNRLTWSGIALHAGNLPGYPASHGCVRLPLEFSRDLFGITKLGMTVVIADKKSFPEPVVHPTFFLSEAVGAEFDAILPRVAAAPHDDTPTATSVVVSAQDRTARVLEGHREVARGPVEIDDPDDPIGTMIYTLTGHDTQKKTLTWSTASLAGPDGGSTPNGDVLRRIRLDDAVFAEASRRAHAGMVLVTTDESSGAQTRTDPGFVVIDSAQT
jgi:hypothetical protein